MISEASSISAPGRLRTKAEITQERGKSKPDCFDFALATCLKEGLQGHFFSLKATQTSSDIRQINLVRVNSPQ